MDENINEKIKDDAVNAELKDDIDKDKKGGLSLLSDMPLSESKDIENKDIESKSCESEIALNEIIESKTSDNSECDKLIDEKPKDDAENAVNLLVNDEEENVEIQDKQTNAEPIKEEPIKEEIPEIKKPIVHETIKYVYAEKQNRDEEIALIKKNSAYLTSIWCLIVGIVCLIIGVVLAPTQLNNYGSSSANISLDIIERANKSCVSVFAYNGDRMGVGSGVLFKKDKINNYSYIVTNHHVIVGAKTFGISLSDSQTKIEATLVGTDPWSDLAVLRIDGINYTYSSLAPSENLQQGASVFTIGNPLGTLNNSFSQGYIANESSRIVMAENYFGIEVLQLNMAINPGNSGGALFNSAGQVIGLCNSSAVVNALNANGQTIAITADNIAFAIPGTTVQSVTNELMLNYSSQSLGYVKGRTDAGVTIGKSNNSNNYIIEAVSGDASTAGLMVNDKVISVTIGKDVYDFTKPTNDTLPLCMVYLNWSEVNDTVKFVISRNMLQQTISVTYSTQYKYVI
ncbi:MAG: S1C family serine protease [Clostridia bacterium]